MINSLRQGAATVLDKQLPDIPQDQRVEFIPVEWRSSLKLDEGNYLHRSSGVTDLPQCSADPM